MEPTEIQSNTPVTDYAGFWLRLAAYIIDYIVLGFVFGGISFFVALTVGVSAAVFDDLDNPANQVLIGTLSTVFGIAFASISWLYYALMECSGYQGTLGKMAVSIKVTDLEGNQISFGRATGRFFGKILSGLILYIGFIMIGFTEKKQRLHDILANCLVVRK